MTKKGKMTHLHYTSTEQDDTNNTLATATESELYNLLSELRQLRQYFSDRTCKTMIDSTELVRMGLTVQAIPELIGVPDVAAAPKKRARSKGGAAQYKMERVAATMLTPQFAEWYGQRLKSKHASKMDTGLLCKLFPAVAKQVLGGSGRYAEYESYAVAVERVSADIQRVEMALGVIKERKAEQKRVAEQAANLNDYARTFTVARRMKRDIVALLGPTNSGKTHEAFESLKAARNGVYLAPLRLLALEIFDRLNAAGVPCNLITGEEKIMVEGARHTSSTIEIADFNTEYEVAIIDEIQLLEDVSRGWAWTAAFLGVAAKTLYLVGAPNIEGTICTVASYLDDNLTIKHKQRLSQLLPTKTPVRLADVKRGDAVVSFSRKGVLQSAQELAQRGLNVATIYGALSPEVRRAQISLFMSGKADVLCCTDVIGMGVNTPSERVIFTADAKYDGVEVRKLNASEVRQIAGRAGRFGVTEHGYYAGSTDDMHRYLQIKIAEELPEHDAPLWIKPTHLHVEKISEMIEGGDKIYNVLQFFTKHSKLTNALFVIADLTEALEVAELVDRICTREEMTITEKFMLVNAPVDLRDMTYFAQCLHFVNKQVQGQLPDVTDALHNIQAAEDYLKMSDLYNWFSRKYSDLFVDVLAMEYERNAVVDALHKMLMQRNKAKKLSADAGKKNRRW